MKSKRVFVSNKNGVAALAKARESNLDRLQEEEQAAHTAREKAMLSILACTTSATILAFGMGLALRVETIDPQTGSIATWKLVFIIFALASSVVLLSRAFNSVEKYAKHHHKAESAQESIDKLLGYDD